MELRRRLIMLIFSSLPKELLSIGQAGETDNIVNILYWPDKLNSTWKCKICKHNHSSFPFRNVYYADSSRDEIGVVSLDGKYQKSLLNEGLFNPRALAIDVQNKWETLSIWDLPLLPQSQTPLLHWLASCSSRYRSNGFEWKECHSGHR